MPPPSSNVQVQELLSDPRSIPLRSSPILLILSDAQLFFARIVPHFLNIFLPIPSGRGIFTDITIRGLFLQVLLTFYSILLFIPLLVLGILIGGLTPILVAFTSAWPFIILQGNTLVQIPSRESSVRDSFRRRHAKESWLYINGVSTSRSGVLLTLRRLETLFQRPIVGIHNKTLGPIVDLLECIIQRDIDYSNQCVRTAYLECQKRLLDDNVEKVVLIAHSQGGIIASLIVDQLLNDLPLEKLDKLEVYTFANAANHFSNPFLNIANRRHTIQHIEHYANGLDPISQIGVLAFANVSVSSGKVAVAEIGEKSQDDPPNATYSGVRFNGRLFVRWNMSGHLILSH